MENETEYLLRRASEETRNAINSNQPQAEVAHKKMALRYSVKAIIALSESDDDNLALGGSDANPS